MRPLSEARGTHAPSSLDHHLLASHHVVQTDSSLVRGQLVPHEEDLGGKTAAAMLATYAGSLSLRLYQESQHAWSIPRWHWDGGEVHGPEDRSTISTSRPSEEFDTHAAILIFSQRRPKVLWPGAGLRGGAGPPTTV